jgi:hypothetical protein
MTTFLDLVKSSVITQAIITIMVLFAVLYMLATGQTVPPDLWALTSLVIGFYFGSKVGIVQGQNIVKSSQ